MPRGLSAIYSSLMWGMCLNQIHCFWTCGPAIGGGHCCRIGVWQG